MGHTAFFPGLIGVVDTNIKTVDPTVGLKVETVTPVVETKEQNLNNGWATEGPQTGTPGALLADTGQLEAGTYDFIIQKYIRSEVEARVSIIKVEHRNAANDTTIQEQELALYSYAEQGFMPINGYTIGANERLRVSNLLSVTHQVGASIFWVRRQ